MPVTNTGQLGSSTQPANFEKCLELAVIQYAGEDGFDDLHRNRHDVNEVGRLGALGLLVNDAVHLVYVLGVSGGPDCNDIAEQGGEPDALGFHGPDLARRPEAARPLDTKPLKSSGFAFRGSNRISTPLEPQPLYARYVYML